MKKKIFKKALAGTLAAALVAGSGLTAFAADYNFEPPTSPMEVDDNIITVSVHRAGSVLPEILGMNTKCGFSMINGSMPTTLEEAKTKLMLGVFGTDANDSPNPYYYNYFYNFYAEENGLELSNDAVIIPENNVAASPTTADTTIVSEYGTSISLAGRPDVLIGVSGSAGSLEGYDSLIQAIRDGLGDEYYQEGDEDYSPYLISYTTTTTYDMIMTLNEAANVMNVITAKTGKTGRYGDPLAIASQFGDYVCGVSTYVLAELEKQGIEKKTVAVVQNINSDGTFTLADAASRDATSTVRGVEYTALVSENIAGDDYLGKTSVTGEELLTADVVILSGSNGGGNDDTALPNTKEGMLEALSVYGIDETDIEDKMIIVSNPDSIYGITMNSIENGMGYGWFVGYMYSDVLDISPVDLCAYFYEQFYHVSDLDSLQSVLSTAFSDLDLPEGMSTDISDYNTDEIDAMLAEGKEYYYNNFEDFSETVLTEVWPEDQSGIARGSSKNYTAADSDNLDLTALEEQVEIAEAMDVTDNDNFTAALTNGQTVLNNSYYFDQDEVDTITTALKKAIRALSTEADTLAVRRIADDGTCYFYISYSNENETADVMFTYGRSTDEVLTGDWDG
ncbi:MAG: hypothetical protein LUF32_09295, partial [Clostridiales bacterium]|nr:hypothetical protein [Clostridiales bacterium]